MSDDWLSLHLFHTGDLDALLTDAVAPAIGELGEMGLRQWFFIRYWNGGPHLRLRLRRPAGLPDAALIAPVRAAFADHLARNPPPPRAQADADRIRAGIAASAALEHDLAVAAGVLAEAAEPLQPDGALQIRPFVFDERRYGGPSLKALTLDHFHRSSVLALAVVRATAGRPASRFTLALHVAAATAMAMAGSNAQLGAFLAVVAGGLERFADGPGADIASRAGLPPFEEVRPSLDDLFDQLKMGLPIPGQTDFVNAVLEAWREEMTSRRAAASRGLSGKPRAARADPDGLLVDYLHMFNNRIGSPTREELYIQHLLSCALSVTAGRAPRAARGAAA
jgi:hypothetical protein